MAFAAGAGKSPKRGAPNNATPPRPKIGGSDSRPRGAQRVGHVEPAAAPPKPRRQRLARDAGDGLGSPKAVPAASFAGLRQKPAPEITGRVAMELCWGDEPSPEAQPEGLVERWVKRGNALLRHLAEHGAARHEYRADLQSGRFVWIGPDGRVSAEASAKLICSWTKSTSVVVMAWADPLARRVSVARVQGFPDERDDIDEEAAFHIAMQVAEASHAQYLYCVTAPHAWYFLSLGELCFTPERSSFSPTTPVGLILQSLEEIRRGIESRAEPTDIVRARLASVGRSVLHEAEYAYRDTDWVARLDRAGRRLLHLADQLPRPSFKSVAAGQQVEEWLNRAEAIELAQAIILLEDEWRLFA